VQTLCDGTDRHGSCSGGSSDRPYTALLEAALAARAVVRKPHLVPPAILPLDEGALAAIHPPASPSDDANRALELASDRGLTRKLGVDHRESILRHHCGTERDRRLTAMCDAIPRVQEPLVGGSVPPLPFELAEYWTNYRDSNGGRDAFMLTFLTGLKRGLRPRVDGADVPSIVARARGGYRIVRREESPPRRLRALPASAAACGVVVSPRPLRNDSVHTNVI
jgi:hypothetical protein